MKAIFVIEKTVTSREEAIAFGELLRKQLPEIVTGADPVKFTIRDREEIDIKTTAEKLG